MDQAAKGEEALKKMKDMEKGVCTCNVLVIFYLFPEVFTFARILSQSSTTKIFSIYRHFFFYSIAMATL